MKGSAGSWGAPVTLLTLVLALNCGHWAQGVLAQQHPSSTRAGLESIQIRPNVHVIFGAGGNVTVHVGDDGLVVVDSGSTEMARSLLDAIKAISPRQIRMVVNTSADLDHVGGNAIVGGAGVGLSPDPFGDGNHATVLAHENVLRRLSALGTNGAESPFPIKMLPNDTFTSRYRSFYVNDDAVQVIRQTGAHSDSDVMVLFRKADVIATGDVIDLRQFPVIEPEKGGSIQGELEALNRLLTEFVVPGAPLVLKSGRTLVVPGHGYIADYAEVVEYRDMVTVIKDTIQELIDKGLTLEQVKAANPAKGYRGRYGSDSGAWTTEKFVEAVFKGLSEKK
ncbi:MAG TPA: MBL fold metallo-hydrolase [Vicinamibacterales bacterium]|nr:MBL fold metallo-hydrolase [Vicinamibacterales bacterium]